jgi:hypothetical protein
LNESKNWSRKGTSGYRSRKRALDLFDTPREAHAFAARVTAMLSVDHFCETVQLSQDKADVYGLTV